MLFFTKREKIKTFPCCFIIPYQDQILEYTEKGDCSIWDMKLNKVAVQSVNSCPCHFQETAYFATELKQAKETVSLHYLIKTHS